MACTSPTAECTRALPGSVAAAARNSRRALADDSRDTRAGDRGRLLQSDSPPQTRCDDFALPAQATEARRLRATTFELPDSCAHDDLQHTHRRRHLSAMRGGSWAEVQLGDEKGQSRELIDDAE